MLFKMTSSSLHMFQCNREKRCSCSAFEKQKLAQGIVHILQECPQRHLPDNTHLQHSNVCSLTPQTCTTYDSLHMS